MPTIRVAIVAGFALLGAVSLPGLANAQMGTVNNPPRQNLFNYEQPRRLDNGLGTNAMNQPTPPRPRAARPARRRTLIQPAR